MVAMDSVAKQTVFRKIWEFCKPRTRLTLLELLNTYMAEAKAAAVLLDNERALSRMKDREIERLERRVSY